MNPAIQVQVIEARNLRSADLFSKSDPYAELTIIGSMHSGKTVRTKTIWNNNSPVWNEIFTLYPESPNDTLRIQLYDKDVGSKDDYLGEVDIPLSRYYNKGTIDDWIPVTGKGGRKHLLGREKGEIHLKVTYGKSANQSMGGMPAPMPAQQPMAPSNPQSMVGPRPNKATEYLGPANPAAAAALGQPSMGVKSSQQPPPYPGAGNRTGIAPPPSVAPSAPPMSSNAPLYPPIQPSTATVSAPSQYPPTQPPMQYPSAHQYPPAQGYAPAQYPPSTPWGSQPPPAQYAPVPPSMQQYPPMQYPPMQGGSPIPPSDFNPIPPFM